jgi:asparagine synthetase B (glutamine-hydrolysing)
MAGFALVLRRDRASAPTESARLASLARRLSPANIEANPPNVFEEAGLARVVINPVAGVGVDRRGVMLGSLFGDADWSTPGGPAPDGTYAIVRHDARCVELLTDVFGSRTIWYVLTDGEFLASTSQRALVALLGSYELCDEAVTWMIASGNLGPNHGWDARLQRVPSASCLRLDRETWTLSTSTRRLRNTPASRSAEQHVVRLRDAIFAACASLDVVGSPSALTLSGGYDSRSLLIGLARAGKPVTCLTWGLAASLDDPGNDAWIARRLAERFNLKHEYLFLDTPDASTRDVFTRFLCAGEGRIEDFSGYTDGLRAWTHIFESGIATIIRGDSPGWGFPFPPINDFVARSMVHEMTLVSDYPESELIHQLDLSDQRPPEGLFNVAGETLDAYRDRIYNDYELPICMSAFNQVKCAYVEVVNPLFARDVVTAALELPDELRHLRFAFEKMVSGLVPDVPFATTGADEPLDRYLRREIVQRELISELSSAAARRILSGPALEAVVAELERPGTKVKSRLRRRAKAVVPQRLIRAVRPAPKPHLETTALAYRAYIASRMTAILEADSESLQHPRQARLL